MTKVKVEDKLSAEDKKATKMAGKTLHDHGARISVRNSDSQLESSTQIPKHRSQKSSDKAIGG